MKGYLKVWTLLALFIASINSIYALEPADEWAIQEVIEGHTAAWNQHGGKGFGKDFAEDADFVNIFGMHFSGKAEIEQRHIQILEGFLKNSIIEILNIQLREVQPGLVVALVCWRLDGYRNPRSDINAPGEMREGIFTQVYINNGNRWEITACQNTLKPPKG